MAQPCPSGWTRVNNCCYFAATPEVGNTQGTWTADNDFCQTNYGQYASVPTFETLEQFSWLVQNVGGAGWLNIRAVGGQFQMLGGSPSTFWKEKWQDGVEPAAADGLSVYLGSNSAISAASAALARSKILCAVYVGDS